MLVRCWGARGSIPVSGREYLRYGGDTTCIELRTRDDRVVVIDAYGAANSTLVNVTYAAVEADGWCAVRGTTPARAYATPLLVFEPSAGKAYIDDVEVRSTVSADRASQVDVRMHARLEVIRARARATLRNEPGLQRSIRSGAPWSARFDPWIR